VRRLLGAAALYLLFGVQLPGCSGQQQDEEELEATGQENNAAEANEEGGEENQAVNNEGGEENQTADEGGGEDQQATDDTAAAGNSTENDLQEIIQEMNGQQGTDPAMANPAMANGTAAPAPVMDQAAAAPAPAPVASSGPTIPFQPGGSPAAPGLPEIGSKMAYVVEKGDTLAKISQKIFGSTGRWNEIATLSGLSNPSRIFPGDLVYYTLDESATAFAAAYESIQKSEEAVQQGDTLATIAQRVYGTTTAWRTIWRHNDRIENPDIVPPGTTVFYIAKGAATAAVKKARAEATKLAQVSKSLNKRLTGAKVTTATGTAKAGKVAKTVQNLKQLAKSQTAGQQVSFMNSVFGVIPQLI
jgi:nucleoid-associated protein YgaU